jgi:hypothetical protein
MRMNIAPILASTEGKRFSLLKKERREINLRLTLGDKVKLDFRQSICFSIVNSQNLGSANKV